MNSKDYINNSESYEVAVTADFGNKILWSNINWFRLCLRYDLYWRFFNKEAYGVSSEEMAMQQPSDLPLHIYFSSFFNNKKPQCNLLSLCQGGVRRMKRNVSDKSHQSHLWIITGRNNYWHLADHSSYLWTTSVQTSSLSGTATTHSTMEKLLASHTTFLGWSFNSENTRENPVYTSALPWPLMTRSNAPPQALLCAHSSCKSYSLVQAMELIHPDKMCICKDAEHHAISWGCGDMKGLNAS